MKQIIVSLLALVLALVTPLSYAFAPSSVTTGEWIKGQGVELTKKGTTIIKSPTTAKIGKTIISRTPAGLFVMCASSSTCRKVAKEAIDEILDGAEWWFDEKDGKVKYKGGEKSCVAWNADGVIYRSESQAREAGYKKIRRVYGYTNGQEYKYSVRTDAEGNTWLSGHTIMYYCAEWGNESTLSEEQIAEKIKERSDRDDKDAQDFLKEVAKKQAEDGDFDDDFNNAKCDNPNYKKNSDGECVPDDDKDDTDDKQCPSDHYKIGDTCIKKPDTDDDGKCECCEDLLQALKAMNDVNQKFFNSSLENDAKLLAEVKKTNDRLYKIQDELESLVEEAQRTNQKIDDLAKQQKLDFKELKEKIDDLKDTLHQDNQQIMEKLDTVNKELDEIDDQLELMTEKLDEIISQLKKANDNIEKMHLCTATEFNKKICEFIDDIKSVFNDPYDGRDRDDKDEDSKLPSLRDDDDKKTNTVIKFRDSCPDDLVANFSDPFGNAYSLVLLDNGKFCTFLVTFIKPAMVAISSLWAIYILRGTNV
ncbi:MULTISPECIES: hypothetical protein [unclassified Moraxella]|uniref:hypothetical protein n=1 Tax=unclassified Moraxella TaxID=2685852 RepID=UPI003AF91AAC